MLIKKDMDFLVYSTTKANKIAIVMIGVFGCALMVSAIFDIYGSLRFAEFLNLDLNSAASLLWSGKDFSEMYSGYEKKFVELIGGAILSFYVSFTLFVLMSAMIASRRRNRRIIIALGERENDQKSERDV